MHERFMEEFGEPENPSSPSSVWMHVGHGVTFGLMEGMEYGLKQAAYKEIRQQRLDSRPLWKIAISDRRIHAAEYDDRRRRDIRHRMRDRSELKSYRSEQGWYDEYIWAGDEEGIEG